MNQPPLLRLLAVLAVVLAGCASPAPVMSSGVAGVLPSPDAVTFTVLQMNDVYEITPVEGGQAGGLARVAGLRAQLLAQDPNTLTVLAGDYLSPSALGTARVDGERLAGKQMVAVLNALGLDAAALGNHEFDVSEEAFAARMAESDFAVISANALQADGTPFPNVARRAVLPVVVAPGDTVRVGVASVVLPSTVKDWIHYLDADSTLRAEVARLDAETDVVLALTHQAFADDATAAATIPGIDAVLGGHEHENVRALRGPRMVPVLKADANARTVFVHHVTLDRRTGDVSLESELVFITPDTPEDPATAAVVGEWVEAAYAGFRADGFEPENVVVTTTSPLDGREGTVRTRPADLGILIAEGFRQASGAEVAILNGGSIRIDDVISAGPFTEYDAIRVLPFGGEVLSVQMTGATLVRALDQGLANAGTGGYLQTAGLARTADGTWTAGGTPIDPARTYLVGVNDFLVSGRESGLGFLDVSGPDLTEVGRHGDVRRALIDALLRAYE